MISIDSLQYQSKEYFLIFNIIPGRYSFKQKSVKDFIYQSFFFFFVVVVVIIQQLF